MSASDRDISLSGAARTSSLYDVSEKLRRADGEGMIGGNACYSGIAGRNTWLVALPLAVLASSHHHHHQASVQPASDGTLLLDWSPATTVLPRCWTDKPARLPYCLDHDVLLPCCSITYPPIRSQELSCLAARYASIGSQSTSAVTAVSTCDLLHTMQMLPARYCLTACDDMMEHPPSHIGTQNPRRVLACTAARRLTRSTPRHRTAGASCCNDTRG